MDLMLPIVNKIENNSLTLQDYSLQPGQINGLAQAMIQTGKPLLKHVFFDNNQITDEMCANMMDALGQRKECHDFIYKRNTFRQQALEALCDKLLTLTPPTNLFELRLVNCDTTSTVMHDLIDILSTSPCYLRSLALVQMKIDFPLNDLALLVDKSEYL